MVHRATTIDVRGIEVPRMAFGLGSLMKWAPNHAYPLPTDSSKEIRQALAAGFRHFNTGDLYTNNQSAADVIRMSGLKRQDLFFSIKLNTYKMLGCGGAQSMIESTMREIERFNLEGYVDLLQLHFPPRGHPGNLSNREAWRVLEELKDKRIARIIGVSNWSLKDYEDIYEDQDLRHPIQVNEYEFNPFLLHDPSYQALQVFEKEHGIINMNYGVLSVLNGRLSNVSATSFTQVLDRESKRLNLSQAELLLSWAYDRLGGLLVSSTSREDRLSKLSQLFLKDEVAAVSSEVYEEMEQAAAEDGFQDKIFYKHGHMDAASAKQN